MIPQKNKTLKTFLKDSLQNDKARLQNPTVVYSLSLTEVITDRGRYQPQPGCTTQQAKLHAQNNLSFKFKILISKNKYDGFLRDLETLIIAEPLCIYL